MPTTKTAPRAKAALHPKAAIRRFDVFAEYNRQQALRDGLPPDQAKGHGIWLAKLVAARRFRGPKTEKPGDGQADGKEAPKRRSKWKSLSGEPQTDKLFDKEIIRRMGQDFYDQVFMPAIRAAFERGASYESIRDSLRREWKPQD